MSPLQFTVVGSQFTVFPINYARIGFAHCCSPFSQLSTLIVRSAGWGWRENCWLIAD